MRESTEPMRFIHLRPQDPYPTCPSAPDVPPLSDADRRLHAPDCHVVMLNDSGTGLARCSLWWTSVPSVDGQAIGIIGHYAAAGADAARALLTQASARLEEAGCTRAVGPMDGNTWRAYRLVTEKGTEPPFFLEPWTPDGWLEQWTAAGFEPIAEYTSALNEDLSVEDPRVGGAAARLDKAGVVIRCLNGSDPERDLHRIFALSLESFRGNFLYAPISEAEFLEQNRRLLPVIRPELVLLAERHARTGDALLGFLFAVPDVLQARRGVVVDTVIIKTVAVSPTSAAAGLGSVLVARAHRAARELGFRRAIHALMHQRNVSRNISRRYASTIRRYALLGRSLRL